MLEGTNLDAIRAAAPPYSSDEPSLTQMDQNVVLINLNLRLRGFVVFFWQVFMKYHSQPSLVGCEGGREGFHSSTAIGYEVY